MGEPQTLRYVTRGHALEEQFLRPLDLEPRHHPVRALAEPARELSVEWNGLRRAALAISGSFGRRWNVLRMNASAPHNCRSSGGSAESSARSCSSTGDALTALGMTR